MAKKRKSSQTGRSGSGRQNRTGPSGNASARSSSDRAVQFRQAAEQAAGQRHHPAFDQDKAGGTSSNRSGRSGSNPSGSSSSFYPDNSIVFPTNSGRTGRNTGTAQAASPNRNRASARQNGERNRTAPRSSTRSSTGSRLRPTPKNLKNPARREKKKEHRLTGATIQRRRLMRRLAALVLLLCVIAVGIYLTVTMLFKINAIRVETADGVTVQELGGYTSEQILSALNVQLEDNIFSFSPAAKSATLEHLFPMLENVAVVREYPNTVVVRATAAQPAYAVQTTGGWLTVSTNLKILEKDSSQPDLPTLYGGDPISLTPGEQLAYEDLVAAASSEADVSENASEEAASSEAILERTDEKLDALLELLTALERYDLLADVTRIEFEDIEQMVFLYQNRISVELGTLNELDYKLKLGQYVLLNEDGKGCAATDTGVLDLSHLSASSTRKFRFAQGEPTLPSGYIAE